MRIKVLGPGCAKCHQLEQTTKEVVKELSIDAEIEYVKDIKKIMEYPILTTPGLVIDEKLVCSGRVPTKAEVTQFITTVLDKEHSDKSILENYKISIVPCGGCPCQAGLIRVVVELSADISTAMPHMSRLIEGCAYNPEANVLSFRMESKGVIVYAQKIIINNAADEIEARRVVDYLRDVINAAE